MATLKLFDPERPGLAQTGSLTSLPRLLPRTPLSGPIGLSEHFRRYGPLPSNGGDRSSRQKSITLVDHSGLRGRGGACFPTALKLAAVANQSGAPIVIANGTEGEPASSKDKLLLSISPHLVLDGAVFAARAVGAVEAVIVCHPTVRELVEAAIQDRERAHVDPVRVRAVDAAGGFVAGEASAVVHWLERGKPIPTRTPPRLSERGLHGRPTLVQNVETLAHLALIARFGPNWYRAIGTDAEPGSMLVTLLGAVHRPGVYEVAIGTRIEAVLDQAGGAMGRPQALLLGGYFGTWTDYEEAVTRPFSQAGLASLGAGPGAGLIAVLASDSCGLAETARVARYLASESAGQCGPCVFGLPAVSSELESLASGGSCDTNRLERWLAQVDGRGACRHPDGVVRMVRSALVVFRSELERHASGRCCSPGLTEILPVPRARR